MCIERCSIKSLVIFIIYAFISFDSFANEDDLCGYRTSKDGTVFTLKIERSFDEEITFQLCERVKPEKSFLISKYNKKVSIKEISNTEYLEFYNLYESALGFNVKDSGWGLDGSSWCLETSRGFTYVNVCFWSPTYNTDKRGLTGFVRLTKELWQIEKFGLSDDQMY